MRLSPELLKVYSNESRTAAQAQRAAQEIAFAPVVFQVSRIMVKSGLLEFIRNSENGADIEEIKGNFNFSDYAIKCLLEASLSIGTVKIEGERFKLTKTGWFLLEDESIRSNMDFNHDVNYLGMFHLEESLINGKPEGLKVFGEWPTIYEGLSSLPPQVQKSWFGFDHLYSDKAFKNALETIFSRPSQVKKILDVGGNTGRWALECVKFNREVEVTVMDLPQQIEMMRDNVAGKDGAERIHGYACNLLDKDARFPSEHFDIIWMSQFLDCFSPKQISDICSRAALSMDDACRLYIMEPFWDRQKYETSAYCLTLTSPYFTAMANGNSKMYHSEEFKGFIENSGLIVEKIVDGLGLGHSIMICRKK